MKTTALVLFTAITAVLSQSVLADIDNSTPPSGPYKSLNSTNDTNAAVPVSNINTQPMNWQNQAPFQAEQKNRNIQNYTPQEKLDWERQRQAQIELLMKQPNMPPPQVMNNPPPQQWINNNQYQPIPNPNYAPNAQTNSLHQYFPSAHGPIYGPGVPPQRFQNQPGYQQPQYGNPFPPIWR